MAPPGSATVWHIILWFSAVLLGALLTILLSEPIQYFLARVVGGLVPRNPRGVKGIWRSEYRFRAQGKMKTGMQLMKLTGFGPWVVGSCLAGEPHRHALRGRVRREVYFTGVWENVQKNRSWHGAFQFVIHPEGRSMRGRWVGFDSENRVAGGSWKWELLSESTSSRAVKEVLTTYPTGGPTGRVERGESR